MFFAKSGLSDVFIPPFLSLYYLKVVDWKVVTSLGLSRVHVTRGKTGRSNTVHMRLTYYCTLCIVLKQTPLHLFDFSSVFHMTLMRTLTTIKKIMKSLHFAEIHY